MHAKVIGGGVGSRPGLAAQLKLAGLATLLTGRLETWGNAFFVVWSIDASFGMLAGEHLTESSTEYSGS